jgi:hypothetical protein
MGWKAEARRTLVGPKEYLTTLPDAETEELHYWIKPRKWSIDATDQIRAKEHEVRSALGTEGLALLAKKQGVMEKLREAYASGESVNDEEVMKLLTAEELATLISGTAPQNQAELITLQILHGVAEWNLEDEDGKVVEITEEEVRDFLDFPDVAGEIVDIVRRWNRPLASGRSQKSGMSQSGSSTDQSSSPTAPTSQTDQTHGS